MGLPIAGLVMLAALTVGGCRAGEPPSAGTPVQSDYLPTATIRELMHSVIDPAADVVWLSVQTIMTEKGTVDIRPRTEEDWDSVRRGAINLMEAANLLMIPGRRVAHPGEKSVRPWHRARAGRDRRVDRERQELVERPGQGAP